VTRYKLRDTYDAPAECPTGGFNGYRKRRKPSVRPSEIRGSQLNGRSLVMRQRGQKHSTCVKPAAAISSSVACSGSSMPRAYMKRGARRSERPTSKAKRPEGGGMTVPHLDSHMRNQVAVATRLILNTRPIAGTLGVTL
jgi:hypothetical protein